MSNKKDASGLTPQERHQIIIDYLKEINKPTKVFHLRWRPGDLVDAKILRSTPMFWYMKYQWTRPQIEGMFFKARIEIDPKFDSSLQQVFGGSPGVRWRGGVVAPKQKKWKQRVEQKTHHWTSHKPDTVVSKDNVSKATNDYEQQQQQQSHHQATSSSGNHKMDTKIASKQKDVWNAVSDFGANKFIDYKMFSDNLRDRGINVSPLLAQQLFDQLAGPSGKMNQMQMNNIIAQLDQTQLPPDFAQISWEDMNGKLGAQMVMKRVLLAASNGEPFNVDDFVFASKFGVSISPIQFMNKLTDRDVPWDDRVRSMEQIAANLGDNMLFNPLLNEANVPELLLGWSTQILDTKPEVQKTAVDLMPSVFHSALEKGDGNQAVAHLQEILDNLFKVLDDPKCARNHPAAKEAVAKLVDDVIAMKDPESVLYLAGLLSEKCDLENVTSAPARAFALEQLQKIMFGEGTPKMTGPATNSKLDASTLPPKQSVHREWMDIAAAKQSGPSQNMYPFQPQQELSALRGKQYKSQESGYNASQPIHSGQGAPESFQGGDDHKDDPMDDHIEDPLSPYAAVSSTPTNAKPAEPVQIDATAFTRGHSPVTKLLYDFGDGSQPISTTEPVMKHTYSKPGSYPITITVTDPNGKTSMASLTQRVKNPKESNNELLENALPPYAHIESSPLEVTPFEAVTFDASDSHDDDFLPCKSFLWTFGDGTPSQRTEGPMIQHKYEKPGSYQVSVEVEDSNHLKSKADLTQRVKSLPKIGHNAKQRGVPKRMGKGQDPLGHFDSIGHESLVKGPHGPLNGKDARGVSLGMTAYRLPPYVSLKATPTNAEPKQPVTLDASDSQDMDGAAPSEYIWDFGDGTPVVKTTTSKVQHPFDKPALTQRVKAPQNDTGPPYVQLESSPKETSPGGAVTFDASKSHDFEEKPCTTFSWNFGDGSPLRTTDVPRTQYSFGKPGTFPVTVTATDGRGQSGTASVQQIVSALDPIAHSAIDSMSPEEQFQSESMSLRGKQYRSQQHDAPESKQSPQSGGGVPEQYGYSGNGNPVSLTKTVYYSPTEPYASIKSTPTSASPSQPVRFDASDSQDCDGDAPLEYQWDFGDGTPTISTQKAFIDHTFDAPGCYPATVTVTDKNGIPSHATLTQRVQNPKDPASGRPYAVLSSSPKETMPTDMVSFDASQSHDACNKPCVSFQWDFGDGTPLQSTSAGTTGHCYRAPGMYVVRVSVTDQNGQSSDASVSHRVTTMDPFYHDAIENRFPPTAHLETNPKTAVPLQAVVLNASQSCDMKGNPCVSFEWDFGDNSPVQRSKDGITSHIYQRLGHYPATVTVIDSNGLKAKAHSNTLVTDSNPVKKSRIDAIRPPVAMVQCDPLESAPKETVTLDASQSRDMYGNQCIGYWWSFGDGSPTMNSKTPIIQHSYQQIGDMVVTVTVKDRNGLKGMASCPHRISKVNPQSASSCTTTWADPLGALTHSAIIKSSDPVYASMIESVGPPFAALEGTPKVTMPSEAVRFDASRSHDFQNRPCCVFEFDFGDKTPTLTRTSPVMQHSYQSAGHYAVSVTVTDSLGLKAKAHCQQKVSDMNGITHSQLDRVNPPFAHFIATPSESLPNGMVTFDASKSKDMHNAPCSLFMWDFGDQSGPQSTKSPVIEHSYSQIGHYPVTLTVTDTNGLTAKVSVNQKVSDQMPANHGDDEKKADPIDDRMDPTELGDEFRGVTADAISKALMDPNPLNAKKAKQVTDVMRALNPQYTKEVLPPEAAKRYNRWNVKMKPLPKKMKPLPDFKMKAGGAQHHEVDMTMKVDFGSFEVPDI